MIPNPGVYQHGAEQKAQRDLFHFRFQLAARGGRCFPPPHPGPLPWYVFSGARPSWPPRRPRSAHRREHRRLFSASRCCGQDGRAPAPNTDLPGGAAGPGLRWLALTKHRVGFSLSWGEIPRAAEARALSLEPVGVPLNRPTGTFSPSGGEGWDEGVRFMGRAGGAGALPPEAVSYCQQTGIGAAGPQSKR